MKIAVIIAAAAVALTGAGAAIAAPVQHTVVHERTVVRDRPAPRAWHTRKVCRTEYRHHHRVRTCRTVRTR